MEIQNVNMHRNVTSVSFNSSRFFSMKNILVFLSHVWYTCRSDIMSYYDPFRWSWCVIYMQVRYNVLFRWSRCVIYMQVRYNVLFRWSRYVIYMQVRYNVLFRWSRCVIYMQARYNVLFRWSRCEIYMQVRYNVLLWSFQVKPMCDIHAGQI